MKAMWIIPALMIAALCGLTACGQAQEEAGLGGGGTPQGSLDEDGDGKIDNVPEGVNDLFTPEDLEAFRNAGLAIFTGENPPTAEGNFLTETLQVTYDDFGLDLSISPYLFLFSGQTASGLISVGYEGTTGNISTGNDAYIAGDEACFSIFADISGYSVADECDYRRPTIYSGCFQDGNISGFAFGFVIAATSGDCSETLPEGHHRIIKEADGNAVCQ